MQTLSRDHLNNSATNEFKRKLLNDSGKFLLFGAGGWLMEYGWSGYPHYSRIWNRAEIPFLPIYAVGGLAGEKILLAANRRGMPFLVRHLMTTSILTGYELAAGLVAEKVYDGEKLWDYSDSKFHYKGYVDLSHSLYWFGLSILFEQIFIKPQLQ